MDINKVLVTGSDGMIGSHTVRELELHGYTVTKADLKSTQNWQTKQINFEDLGQVVGVMAGHDAVIHMAAIPSPGRHPNEMVFQNNVMSTFNVLEAATILGIKNVVTASSLSALGYAFYHRHFDPVTIPIDEEHPLLSQDTYGLSKMVGEMLADGFLRRTPDMSLVSLRFTLVANERIQGYIRERRESDDPEPYGAFWTYVDVRDAAVSCRLSMEYNTPGHEAFYISAPNIYRKEPIQDLLRQCYPGDYPIADHITGSVSPVDCSKAEKILGWTAKHNFDGTEF